MAFGSGNGTCRAKEAVQQAIENSLLNDVSIQNATGVWVNITANHDFADVLEIKEVSDRIYHEVNKDSSPLLCLSVDESARDEIRVTILAFEGREITDDKLQDYYSQRLRGKFETKILDHNILALPSGFMSYIQTKGISKLAVGKLDNYLCFIPKTLSWLSDQVKISPDDEICAFFFSTSQIKDFLDTAVECEISVDYSIIIPPKLLSATGINKDVILKGMLNYFELWDKSAWDEDTGY